MNVKGNIWELRRKKKMLKTYAFGFVWRANKIYKR